MTNLTQIQRTIDIPQAMQRFLDERGVKQPEIVKLSGVNKAGNSSDIDHPIPI